MKIIKPGKPKMVKLTCPSCGCVFIEGVGRMDHMMGHYFALCPEDNCGQEVCVRDDALPSMIIENEEETE